MLRQDGNARCDAMVKRRKFPVTSRCNRAARYHSVKQYANGPLVSLHYCTKHAEQAEQPGRAVRVVEVFEMEPRDKTEPSK